MHKDNKSVFGIYNDRGVAEHGVSVLKMNGFRMSDISLLLPQQSGASDVLATSKATKAPEGTAAGAGTGAVVGGTLGLLAGIGAIAIPGLGPFIAAGPIMAALAGLGLGGAVGAVSGALIGLGIPEYEAKAYEGYVKDGGILISVHVDDDDWANKAKKLLDETGAKNVAVSSPVKTEAESYTSKPFFKEPPHATNTF